MSLWREAQIPCRLVAHAGIGLFEVAVEEHGRNGLVETVQPPKDIGDAVADLSADSDSRWAASVGAQVVDGLHVHAEILGELARREDSNKLSPRNKR
jgi:hypothetical protein